MTQFKVGDKIKVVAIKSQQRNIGIHSYNFKGCKGVILTDYGDGWYEVNILGQSSESDIWHFMECHLHKVIE